jgi:WD40 repeat protein
MPTNEIKDAAVDAEGRWAVTGSEDKTVRVWSLADGALLRTVPVPVWTGRRRQNLCGGNADISAYKKDYANNLRIPANGPFQIGCLPRLCLQGRLGVESRCDAVAVGRTYL